MLIINKNFNFCRKKNNNIKFFSTNEISKNLSESSFDFTWANAPVLIGVVLLGAVVGAGIGHLFNTYVFKKPDFDPNSDGTSKPEIDPALYRDFDSIKKVINSVDYPAQKMIKYLPEGLEKITYYPGRGNPSDFDRVSTINQSMFREKVLAWVDENLSEDTELELSSSLDKILEKTRLMQMSEHNYQTRLNKIENIFEELFFLFQEKLKFAVTYDEKLEVLHFIERILYDKLFLPLGLHKDSIIADYFKISGNEPMPFRVTSCDDVVLELSLVRNYNSFQYRFLSWFDNKDFEDCQYSPTIKQMKDRFIKIDKMVDDAFEQKNIGLLKDIDRRFYDLHNVWNDRFIYPLAPPTIKEQEEMLLEIFTIFNRDAVFSFPEYPFHVQHLSFFPDNFYFNSFLGSLYLIFLIYYFSKKYGVFLWIKINFLLKFYRFSLFLKI